VKSGVENKRRVGKGVKETRYRIKRWATEEKEGRYRVCGA